MSLIECHECGGRISDTAAACPHCGAPRLAEDGTVIRAQQPDTPPAKRKSLVQPLLAGLGLIIVLSLIARVIGSAACQFSEAPAPIESSDTAGKWQEELQTVAWPDPLKTEEQRRAYYDDVCDAEERYVREAEEAFPTDMSMPDGISQDEQFDRQMDRMTELKAKYLGEIRERYQVTDALEEQLIRESIIKKWRPKDN